MPDTFHQLTYCETCCERHRKQETYIWSPHLELMNEDVGVATGIVRHQIGNITHSAHLWSLVSFS
jgi:hypothetical protein